MTASMWLVIEFAVRTLHVIAAIAWVGASFYFMWLERRLNVPARDAENAHVAGDLWALHSGAFYHSQKYASLARPVPSPLHRFRWQAYTTGLSGFALMYLVYYTSADLYLVKPESHLLDTSSAIATSIAMIVATWITYHLLCRWLADDRHLTAIGALLILAGSAAVCALYTGRGAFLQMGAMLGTTMVANVFFVIMRAQREILSAIGGGESPDPRWSARAQRRSLHNNYLTLPVLVCMLSPHYPLLYGSRDSWAVLAALMLASALARHAVNRYHAGASPWPAMSGCVVVIVAIFAAITPSARAEATAETGLAEVRAVVDARCLPCHASAPTYPGMPSPAAGVALDSNDDVIRWAPRIWDRVAVSRTMPLNNATKMTDAERALIGRWFESGTPTY